QPWQEALEEIIKVTKSAAVLVGADGFGPWEVPEMRACLSQFVDRKLPVIPVLLPGAPAKPALPLFLMQFTWVDLREGLTVDGLDRLVWGITGKKPDMAGRPMEMQAAGGSAVQTNSVKDTGNVTTATDTSSAAKISTGSGSINAPIAGRDNIG